MMEGENNKLSKILDLLMETEIIKGRHILASFHPWRNDDIIEQNKYLDTLARLFAKNAEIIRLEGKGKSKAEERKGNKGDVCVAVCYDKRKKVLTCG